MDERQNKPSTTTTTTATPQEYTPGGRSGGQAHSRRGVEGAPVDCSGTRYSGRSVVVALGW